MDQWQYGQTKLKHIEIKHPLSGLVADSLSPGWDLGPLPRGGNGYTPGSTGNNYNQTSGATFRVIIPVGDWDRSLGINSPGQSGDPESPYYDNLFDLWARDQVFPAFFSRAKIESVLFEEVQLRPAAGAPPAPDVAAAPPGTDVWLLALEQQGDTLRAHAPRNLTQRPGYDNQPFFTPSGELMFVQMEDERTDLWRWNPVSERVTRLTRTPQQGEFSPTPIPGSQGGISYIRSPTNTDGRLWRMPREGADAEIVFPDIGPVGYHAWFDADHVALWLLQEPSVLQWVKLGATEGTTIATGVGRSPQSVPGRRAVSFTRAIDGGTVVEAYDLDRQRTEALAMLPAGGEFHGWTPGGVLLGTAGSRVVAWRGDRWDTVADLAPLGVRLSRLAVSPDGSRLAVVAEPIE